VCSRETHATPNIERCAHSPTGSLASSTAASAATGTYGETAACGSPREVAIGASNRPRAAVELLGSICTGLTFIHGRRIEGNQPLWLAALIPTILGPAKTTQDVRVAPVADLYVIASMGSSLVVCRMMSRTYSVTICVGTRPSAASLSPSGRAVDG
jgi:hypothetical protein